MNRKLFTVAMIKIDIELHTFRRIVKSSPTIGTGAGPGIPIRRKILVLRK